MDSHCPPAFDCVTTTVYKQCFGLLQHLLKACSASRMQVARLGEEKNVNRKERRVNSNTRKVSTARINKTNRTRNNKNE